MTSSRSNLLSLVSPSAAVVGAKPAEEALTLRGSLGVVSLLDVLQWLCNAKQSWTVRLSSQGVDGEVIVREGELVSARWGSLFGMTALTEIVSTGRGTFELLPPVRTSESNLSGSWQSLLLEAAQELDERCREREQRARLCPPSRPPVSLTCRSGEHALAERYSEMLEGQDGGDSGYSPSLTAHGLIDQGFAALRDGNLNEARERWLEALRLEPNNRRIQFNLRKLDSMPPR